MHEQDMEEQDIETTPVDLMDTMDHLEEVIETSFQEEAVGVEETVFTEAAEAVAAAVAEVGDHAEQEDGSPQPPTLQFENDSELMPPPEKKSKKSNSTNPSNNRLVSLPLARIRQLMKMDPDVTIASADAVFLITKATELFIEALSKESYSYTAASKKKTVQRKDVDSAIANADALIFLEGCLD